MIFKKLVYKGNSKDKYHKIISILELNNIKYTDKIEVKSKDKGPMIDKMYIGSLPKNEDLGYTFIIYVSKEKYNIAKELIINI